MRNVHSNQLTPETTNNIISVNNTPINFLSKSSKIGFVNETFNPTTESNNDFFLKPQSFVP